MEIKKTPEADLERGRTTFFLMGLVLALSGLFVLLEWKSSEIGDSNWTSLAPVFIENEFGWINRAETSVPIGLPDNSEPEIVYEDYIITNDIPVVEVSEVAPISALYPESDETPFSQTINESTTLDEINVKTNTVVTSSAEIMPQFPGGQMALARFIIENAQYPSAALKQRIEGRVWCSFVVETDGSISNVQLENRIYIFLDEEALRVVKMMPVWVPGQTNGENVRVKVYIPIVFKR